MEGPTTDRYVVNGGKPLNGTVTISGAKNAAVAIIPAAILADEPCIIENVPLIDDVYVLKAILEKIGAVVEFLDERTMKIDPRPITTYSTTFDLVRKMRASYYLAGAMLGKFNRAEVALPGGCDLGPRPIDQHLKGMAALGAESCIEEGILKLKAAELTGGEIYLDIVSVGATINIMLAASRARGNTVIVNAAKEPHVVDVANFLNMMGASIKGAGTDIIRITGRDHLHGCSYAVIPDQVEAATFMIAAAATKGDVIIKNIIPTHLEAISAKLMEMGAYVFQGDDGSEFYIRVSAGKRPRCVNVKTLPYPGFPTDLQQPIMSLLSVAEGTSVIVENIFEDRFKHVRYLQKMGADITINKRVAVVQGVDHLTGTKIKASDLRAGAALVVAALMAEGRSEIENIYYIDRGYELFEQKLTALGADIHRVKV